MNWFKLTFVFVLVFCAMGAGPCDVLDSDPASDDEDDASEGCEANVEVCNHSLDFDILLADAEEYPAGMYSFEIVAPDESEYAIDCYMVRPDAGMDCSGPNIDELIAWIDPQDYSLIHFHVNGAPPSCIVRVLYEDYTLSEKYIEPDYDTSYPNGEGCEPVCYAGTASLAVAIY
ncbi:MAG: hypothetical protein JXX29_07375 [Deltaproteobacteria bacterium]|nr:hypothetical protein [Deltaproteobacteria bacterium]MBN2671476.1 hypothetical protein [Deltaproteobacteria bacterium]